MTLLIYGGQLKQPFPYVHGWSKLNPDGAIAEVMCRHR